MRILKARSFRYLLQVSLVLMLPACGVVDSGGSQGVGIGDPTNRQVPEQSRVILDAAELVDVASIATFRWSKLRGPSVTLANAETPVASFIAPAVKAPDTVVFVFRLNVTDEFGARDFTDVTITVVSVNAPPTVDAGADRAIAEGLRVVLSGSARDSDGARASVRWSQVTGPTVALARAGTRQPSFIAPDVAEPELLTFRLTATDDEGAVVSDDVVVTVNPIGAPPPQPPPPGGNPPPGGGPGNGGPGGPPGGGGPGGPPGGGGPGGPPGGGGPGGPPGGGGPGGPPGGGGPGGPPGGGGPGGPPGGGPGNGGPGGPPGGGPGDDDDDDDDGDEDGFAILSSGASHASPAACWAAPWGRAVRGTLPSGGKTVTPVMFRLVTNARHGIVSMLDPTTGKFQYTPARPAAGGADAFTYQKESLSGARQLSAMVLRMPAIMTLGGGVAAGVINAAQRLPQPSLRTGYRRPLEELLAADGYAADFVGSQSFGSGVENFDPDNEAHAGWTGDELAYGRKGDGSDGIYAWLAAHPADIVLLQLAMEHLAAGPYGVEAILDEIDRWEASPGGRSVTVLISGILRQAPANPAVRAFNTSIAAMVTRRSAGSFDTPDKILGVDHAKAMRSPASFGDRSHPNQAGYRKLAEVWRDTLVDHELLEKCP